MTSREEFAVRASPWEWRDCADELRDAAKALFERHPDELVVTSDPYRGVVKRRPLSNAAALLAGLALENLIKAVLVTEDPSLVAEGSVKRLKSHTLEALVQRSNRITLQPPERDVCALLSAAIPVWGRYPVPLQAQDVSASLVFDEAAFAAFDALYTRISAELDAMLGDVWPGPHGMQIESGTLKPR